MGVYVYSLRKDAKIIDGKKIGRVRFGYKCHSFFRGDRGYAYYERRVALTHANAERARDAHPDLEHVVISGDDGWSGIGQRNEPDAVYEVSKNFTHYYDTSAPGKLVGHLVRDGRKLRFVPVVTAELAAAGVPLDLTTISVAA